MRGLFLENAGKEIRKVKAVERLGTFVWNGALLSDFFLHILTKSMFYFCKLLMKERFDVYL